MDTKSVIIAGAVVLLTFPVLAQQSNMKPEETEVWEPEPRMVTTTPDKAPSDAIVLFDGSSLNQWVSQADGSSPAPWDVSDGSFTVVRGKGDRKRYMSGKRSIVGVDPGGVRIINKKNKKNDTYG